MTKWAKLATEAMKEPPVDRTEKPKRKYHCHTPIAKKADPVLRQGISVNVDWNNIPMDQARILYAELKSQLEKAGAILNNRSMPREDHYICFMCKTEHQGDPRGKDYARTDPQTGLMVVVLICGERCWIQYQDMCIKERKANEMARELGYDQEMKRQLFTRYDKNLDGLINELGQRLMQAKA